MFQALVRPSSGFFKYKNTNIFIFMVCLDHSVVKMELFWLKFPLIGQHKLNLGDSWFDSHTLLNQMAALVTGSFSFVFS